MRGGILVGQALAGFPDTSSSEAALTTGASALLRRDRAVP